MVVDPLFPALSVITIVILWTPLINPEITELLLVEVLRTLSMKIETEPGSEM